MKGDFSRHTFDPAKSYSGVRMQQGRVQLDADWNEQLDLAGHLRETALTDLVGALAVPLASQPDGADAFGVVIDNGEPALHPGRAYVHGALVSLGGSEPTPLTAQTFLPGYELPEPGEEATLHLAYLAVWRRTVNALEDPAIRESALGGPDTAVRDQTVWQVRLQGLPAGTTDCGAFTSSRSGPAPRLRVRVDDQAPPRDNRLYRIEVHEGGSPEESTFKWSRDNASVVARVESVSDAEIRLESRLPQDFSGILEDGAWVEVTDRGRVLRGEPGELARLSAVSDDARVLTVEGWYSGYEEGVPASLQPTRAQPELDGELLRLWSSNSSTGPVGVASAPAESDGYLALEDGIEVRFEHGDDTVYRVGDHWQVAARAATAGVEWPLDANGAPLALEPGGPLRREVPLAVLQLGAEGEWSVVSDCRPLFLPGPALRPAGPVFLSTVELVAQGGEVPQENGSPVWATYDLGQTEVPPTATAVILQASASMDRPDSSADPSLYVDTVANIYIRERAGSPALLLLRGQSAGPGDRISWGQQGVFPIHRGQTTHSFGYVVTVPGFNLGWTLSVVGYYR